MDRTLQTGNSLKSLDLNLLKSAKRHVSIKPAKFLNPHES